jgi:acyl transferase domain-containing protein
MGCRFPGGIGDAQQLWEALCADSDVLGEVPASRWDARALYDPDPAAPGGIYATRGGFIEGLEAFDAAFFGVSRREAERMDPQQRLLLEVGWEALEDAGLDPTAQRGHRTGVYVGISHSDYWEQLASAGDRESGEGHALTGNEVALASGRLSYAWGLVGPAVSVATACSSALVAIHQAVRALRNGECERALAGGVNAILGPAATQYLCRLGALAPDGRCKAFDAAADGYVRSEGCGLVVLERLDDARAGGRRILAVIKGSAVGQDGRSNGLTAPNGAAQTDVVRRAMADAGVTGRELDFVEAHGTGTALGDPIELHALADAVGRRDDPVRVTTVKSRLGHLESAAGVAGLLAAVVALRHGVVPRTLHFRDPNPLVRWDGLPIAVVDEPWPLPQRGRPPLAGVSSFGFSGTNAHVVLQAAPSEPPRLHRADPGPWVIPLAAHSTRALAERARALGRPPARGWSPARTSSCSPRCGR